MTVDLHIVTTCTQRKKATVSSRLQLRSVSGKSIKRRVLNWHSRLRDDPAEAVPARDLYAGEHWSVFRSLEKAAPEQGLRAQLWVCSAGCGLIPMDETIKPYGATFSTGHPDSVVRPEDGTSAAVEWWLGLAEFQLSGGHPRSLAELAAASPRTPILVAASRPYLRAMHSDLQEAREALSGRDLLSIISSNKTKLAGLEENLLPCDARLQAQVGGARQALNVRVLSHVILAIRPQEFTVPCLRGLLGDLLQQAPKLSSFSRTPMSDEEVRQFIRSALRSDPTMHCTPLLREFRDGGNACEQSRFKTLFREVTEDLHA